MARKSHKELYADFCRQTANHRLVVIYEFGVVRHLFVGEVGTGMWSWDVITWPGYLTTVGDVADGYTFCRINDMLDFFDTRGRTDADGVPQIDYRYWAEKLQGPARNAARVYDHDEFMAWVRDALAEHSEMGDEAFKEVSAEIIEAQEAKESVDDLEAYLNELRTRRQEILDDASRAGESEQNAHEWIYAYDTDGSLFGDPSEAEHGTSDGFVLVQGGLVQNDPGLEVFDLDVLDSDLPDEQVENEILDLFKRLTRHSNRRGVQPYLDRVAERLRDTGSPETLAEVAEILARHSRIE